MMATTTKLKGSAPSSCIVGGEFKVETWECLRDIKALADQCMAHRECNDAEKCRFEKGSLFNAYTDRRPGALAATCPTKCFETRNNRRGAPPGEVREHLGFVENKFADMMKESGDPRFQ